jgi:hypothetical protein
MNDLQIELNELFDTAIVVQIIAAFDQELNYSNIQQIVFSLYDFIEKSDELEVRNKLPEIHEKLDQMIKLCNKKYPLKTNIVAFATEWNDFFKHKQNLYSSGIEYGWLNKHVDLKNLGLYKQYVPYNFKIGLVSHKGHFSIEEDFLLNDSFNMLVQCEKSKLALDQYAGRIKKSNLYGDEKYQYELYSNISLLKLEISSYARSTIISFYAFVECFINSVGYSYLMYNLRKINNDNKEILEGRKNNRYLSLKDKMNIFPKIINEKYSSKTELFVQNHQDFFDIYGELRNSSVHHSPLKENIWLMPDIWINKAKDFSRLAIEISMNFWNKCFAFNEGPEYLNKLNYQVLYDEALEREKVMQKIKNTDYLVKSV